MYESAKCDTWSCVVACKVVEVFSAQGMGLLYCLLAKNYLYVHMVFVIIDRTFSAGVKIFVPLNYTLSIQNT